MALIKCSECGREISDKAAACPGCGAPLTPIPNSVRVTRKGGQWEGIGFALIVVGIVIGIVSNPALGWIAGLAGLVVFIVGRLSDRTRACVRFRRLAQFAEMESALYYTFSTIAQALAAAMALLAAFAMYRLRTIDDESSHAASLIEGQTGGGVPLRQHSLLSRWSKTIEAADRRIDETKAGPEVVALRHQLLQLTRLLDLGPGPVEVKRR